MTFLGPQDRCLIPFYLTPKVASCPKLFPNGTKSSEGFVDIHYETVLRKDTFRFICAATVEEYNQLLPDASWELRWIIEPTKIFSRTDESVFDIESVIVAGKQLNIKREYRDGRFVIIATHPELESMIGQQVNIDYRYKTKFQKRGHLLMINVPCPTKNVSVELDYHDTDIHYVNIQDLLVSKAKSVIHYFPSQIAPRRIEIAVDEWVFPKGGVVFVWTLRSEMTPDFLKLLAQNKSPARPNTKTTHQLPPPSP